MRPEASFNFQVWKSRLNDNNNNINDNNRNEWSNGT